MVHTALEAATTLAADGVEVEVLDLRSLAPLDREAILTSVAKTSRVLLLHEARLTGGIGGELAAHRRGRGVRISRRAGHAAGLGGHAGALRPPLEAAFLPSADEGRRLVREADR